MALDTKTFHGETISETLASVLRDEPQSDALPADTPAAVQRLIRRCLDRDRNTRLRDIGEARIALSPAGIAMGAESDAESTGEEARPPQKNARLPWTVAAVAVAATLALAWIAFGRGRVEPALEIRAAIEPPPDQAFVMVGNRGAGALSISP